MLLLVRSGRLPNASFSPFSPPAQKETSRGLSGARRERCVCARQRGHACLWLSQTMRAIFCDFVINDVSSPEAMSSIPLFLPLPVVSVTEAPTEAPTDEQVLEEEEDGSCLPRTGSLRGAVRWLFSSVIVSGRLMELHAPQTKR